MKKIILTSILFLIFSIWNNSIWYWCMDYWLWATDNYDWTCSCRSGYHFETNSFWNTQCVANPTCYDLYWFMAYKTLSWTCSCRNWYHLETNSFWNTQCVVDPTCRDLYWFWATDNYNWTCSCSYWYLWGTDMYWKKQCVNWNSSCKEEYGVMANYDSLSWKCKCFPWYYFWDSQYLWTKCITWKELCENKFWDNSKFNLLSKECECENWYTFKNWKCEEKHNSAYFYLSEYDDNKNKALIISYTTKIKYLLELKYTSWLYKAENFIWKDIVINMWTDFNIDKYDKFILNNQTKTTDIISDILYIEEVSDNYTLKTCKDVFWENSKEAYNNKCICKTWYQWTYDKTSCKEIEENKKTNYLFIEKKEEEEAVVEIEDQVEDEEVNLDNWNEKLWWESNRKKIEEIFLIILNKYKKLTDIEKKNKLKKINAILESYKNKFTSNKKKMIAEYLQELIKKEIQ